VGDRAPRTNVTESQRWRSSKNQRTCG
jgi:hypothetical protein